MKVFKLKQLTVKELTLISFFIALQIILTRFVSIQLPTVRLDFNFIALVMCAIIFGPIWGGIAAVIADFLGVSLFTSFGFFPGFALSMFMEGIIYGYFLHRKPITYTSVIVPVVLVNLIVSLGLGTLWVIMMTDSGFIALLPARLTKVAVMIPLQIALIPFIWDSVGPRIAVMAVANDSDS